MHVCILVLHCTEFLVCVLMPMLLLGADFVTTVLVILFDIWVSCSLCILVCTYSYSGFEVLWC